MKLKVKCANCSRVHIVKADVTMKASTIADMDCLYCGKVIHYRISTKKKEDDFGLEDLMKIFGMK